MKEPPDRCRSRTLAGDRLTFSTIVGYGMPVGNLVTKDVRDEDRVGILGLDGVTAASFQAVHANPSTGTKAVRSIGIVSPQRADGLSGAQQMLDRLALDRGLQTREVKINDRRRVEGKKPAGLSETGPP